LLQWDDRNGKKGVAMASKDLDLDCYFCGKALKSDDAYFVICDRELPPFSTDRTKFVRINEHGDEEVYGVISYPEGIDKNFERVVLFAHAKCGSDDGYAFSFDRLGEDWDEHLHEKPWWAPVIDVALARARASMGIKKPRPREYRKGAGR
jgi:hypothetical protein